MGGFLPSSYLDRFGGGSRRTGRGLAPSSYLDRLGAELADDQPAAPPEAEESFNIQDTLRSIANRINNVATLPTRLFPTREGTVADMAPAPVPGAAPLATAAAPTSPHPLQIRSLDPAPSTPVAAPSGQPSMMEGLHDSARAARYRSPVRAIRMPGGKIVFTNRDELGGEEVGVSEAGREIRDREMRGSPTTATMSALVRASARSHGQPLDAPYTAPTIRTSPGEAPDSSPGVSFIEGTPQQQAQLKIDDAMSATVLANLQREQELAEMDPRARALLENKDVQTASYLLSRFQPQIDRAREDAAARIQVINQTVVDPKERRAALQEVDAELERSLAPLQAIMQTMMGIRAR